MYFLKISLFFLLKISLFFLMIASIAWSVTLLACKENDAQKKRFYKNPLLSLVVFIISYVVFLFVL